MSAHTTVILAGHGDGDGSPANERLIAHAEALASGGVAGQVIAAFHRGTPGFATALDASTGSSVVVVPVMASAGYYAETILPAQLRRSPRHGELRPIITKSVGAHPRVAVIAARRIVELRDAEAFPPTKTVVLVVGHGTRRHRRSRATTLSLATALRRRAMVREVHEAFLDDTPSLESVAARFPDDHVIVLPFLIGGGAHALRDVPRHLGVDDPSRDDGITVTTQGARRVVIDRAIGTDPGIPAVIADLVLAALQQHPPASAATGRVSLVGAGPGAPGLITVTGAERLRRADVVVTDRLVPQALLERLPATTRVIDAGKRPGEASRQDEIQRILIDEARAGRQVVRLKGGDPYVFGRGAEEVDACRAAGVTVEVVPGVTSAIAVPAAAGIPVTRRGVADGFAVVTALGAEGETIDFARYAGVDTLVILMGRRRLEALTAELLAAGRAPETPAAAIQDGTTPAQRVVAATLATLAERVAEAGLDSPVVLVIGAVAASAVATPSLAASLAAAVTA